MSQDRRSGTLCSSTLEEPFGGDLRISMYVWTPVVSIHDDTDPFHS